MAVNQNNQVKVLIVSLPGMMETLLKRTIKNHLNVDIVGTASGGLSAASIIQESKPDLVIVESNLPEFEMVKLVEWIKAECHDMQILVLVESSQQLVQAQNAGADFALWSFTLQEKLDQVISKIRPDSESEKSDIDKGVNHAG